MATKHAVCAYVFWYFLFLAKCLRWFSIIAAKTGGTLDWQSKLISERVNENEIWNEWASEHIWNVIAKIWYEEAQECMHCDIYSV